MSDLNWTVTADEVEQIAAVLGDMAQNMRAGYMEAARGGDGFLFRITPRGEAYVQEMTAGDECGDAYPFDASLRCQRDPGHSGDHAASPGPDRLTRRWPAAGDDEPEGLEDAAAQDEDEADDPFMKAERCGSRPYPAGSEGDDGTECVRPKGHPGDHSDEPIPFDEPTAAAPETGAVR
jgi:hypothetical protein